MLTIGVLCSGGLGFSTLKKITRDYTVSFVLTDSKSLSIISFCNERNVPLFMGNPRSGKGFAFIKDLRVDIIVSINYLFLIEEDIIDHSNVLTFNIHGSLLPKYRGRTPHVWAIINGETKVGITAHVIDSGCDTGDIINQIEIEIEKDDTGGIVLEKYAEAYFPLVKKVISNIENNTLRLTKQKEEEATYYGKRTPDDGEINWNWTMEAIRNWVRAQAYPYPGAFTFLDRNKIIIDKVSFFSIQAEHYYVNGEIIALKPNPVVKVKNGALYLETIRSEKSNFAIGNIFSNENR